MTHPMTQAFRPVCRAVNQALQGGLPSGPFNFGLYFMKWFFVADGLPPREAPRPKKPWACCLADETKVKQRDRYFEPNILLDNLEISLALFNGEQHYTREMLQDRKGKLRAGTGTVKVPVTWDRAKLKEFLEKKYQALEAAARSFVPLGYEYLRLERQLTSPLILGLGLEHPSEKGFRFDWTLGLPVIPASGLKGVVRLAWLVQQALVRNLRQAGYNTLDRGTKDDAILGHLAVLAPRNLNRPSQMPAIIGEALFMTNDADAAQLSRTEMRLAIARGYLEGIKAFFGDD
uniref:MurNAc-LAA domain-containing protein n=1 Tax=Desulfobacca acetoxidans TaxID=60893 RepID=A0A7V4G7L7_9BACT